MRRPPSLFLTQLQDLRERGVAGRVMAQVLRLPLAEAERLGLVEPQPWSSLAWRIEANRVRWRRRNER